MATKTETKQPTLSERVALLERRANAVFAPAALCTGCLYSDEPWHDPYLTLEASAEGWLSFFFDSETETERIGMEGLSDLAYFIRTHGWQDPNRMALVAERIELMHDNYVKSRVAS